MKRNIYIFFILILFTFSTAYSQWNLLNLGGGSTGPIISTKPGTFFVATGLGIYRSTNSTLSWQNVSDNGIGSFWRSYPYAMAGRGDTVIFGTYGHVIGGAHIFITTDNGTNWRLISTGVRVSSFIFKDNCLIYTASVEGQGDGIYRSTDVGQTWTLVSNQSIRNFILYGNNIYVTSNYGLYRTSDY